MRRAGTRCGLSISVSCHHCRRWLPVCCITVLVFQHLQYHHHPICHPHHTAFTRCILSSFARNVTRFGAIAASPLKSVRITVRIVFSRYQAPAYAPRRTGVPRWSSFHSKVGSNASILDVLAIASCVQTAEIRCPWCRLTHRTQEKLDFPYL